MKTTLYIALLLAAVCSAQEPNPFVKQQAKDVPAGETGEAFTELAEHIIVPADLLDDWLAEHPMKGDAAELRRVAQTWVDEGKAKLDHTGIMTGTVGRDCINESVNEQVYATEYIPNEPDEWTLPTSFENRKLGYTMEGGASHGKEGVSLRARVDVVRMLPHRAWSALAEATRQPTDVFIPRFRAISVSQEPLPSPGVVVSDDPFAEPSAPVGGTAELSQSLKWRATMPLFMPGKTYLAARADEDLPLPVDAADRQSVSIKIPNQPANRPVRLIFFRGVVAGKTTAAAIESREEYALAARLVAVDQKILSDWLQKQDLSMIAESAWAMAEEWRKGGTATVIQEAAGTCRSGSKGIVGNIVEVTYPTEWNPGERLPAENDRPARREPSSPTAFETRNTGFTVESTIVDDPKGSMLKVSLDHVIHGGNSVHHRIFRDEEWKPDITFPLMSTLRWNTEVRVKSGAWILVGTGAMFDSGGRFDPAKVVMAFVKVE